MYKEMLSLSFCFEVYSNKFSSIKMEDLVRYFVDWDVFEYHCPLQNIRKSVPCKQKTKQFCILLDGDPYITVKLHDTVHYVVI